VLLESNILDCTGSIELDRSGAFLELLEVVVGQAPRVAHRVVLPRATIRGEEDGPHLALEEANGEVALPSRRRMQTRPPPPTDDPSPPQCAMARRLLPVRVGGSFLHAVVRLVALACPHRQNLPAPTTPTTKPGRRAGAGTRWS
jgi:hypothetical protein